MKQYFTGFFTAFCLTASAFLFLGAQNNDLGDVIVRSLKVIDDEGNEVVTLASYKLGGFIWVWNSRGVQAVEMSVDGNSGGYFRANDIGGKNQVEVRAGGNDSRDRDGMVVLSDQNGQIGWSINSKQ